MKKTHKVETYVESARRWVEPFGGRGDAPYCLRVSGRLRECGYRVRIVELARPGESQVLRG